MLQEDEPSKRGRFVFKLAKTVDSGGYVRAQELNTPLLKLSDDGDARHFILEQRKRKREEQELPAEISEMLNDYLSLESRSSAPTEPRALKRPGGRKSEPNVNSNILPSIGYVYDIYYREVVPEDEFVFDDSTVGYIKIVEDNGDLIPEEEEDDNSLAASDDEDSNEEAYYRNDYPEDEDDDRSILFGSEEGAGPAGRNSLASSDGSSGLNLENLDAESMRGHVAMLGENETDLLFQRFSGVPDVLKAAGHELYDLDDDLAGDSDEELQEELDTAEFKRHNFFPSDADDPLAIHRDRIFDKLQRMINKR